jgi:short-subunit dehydrogenase
MTNFRLAVGVALFAAFVFWVLFPLDPFLVDPAAVAGKRVLITGASLGIGKALAFEYANRNVSHMVLVSRSVEGLNKVRDDIFAANEELSKHMKIDIVAADLCTEKASLDAIEQAVLLMGGLDVLVLNHITSTIMDSWLDIEKRFSYMADTFNVNTFSYIWMATAAIEHLKKSSGQIVVVSSFAGHVGVPKTTIYSAAKHALHGFFDGFRNELVMAGIDNVGITLCAIGSTDTEGAKSFKKRITSVTWDPPQDAATAIVNGGALRRRDIYHPQYLVYPSVIIDTLFPSAMDYFIRDSLKTA